MPRGMSILGAFAAVAAAMSALPLPRGVAQPRRYPRGCVAAACSAARQGARAEAFRAAFAAQNAAIAAGKLPRASRRDRRLAARINGRRAKVRQ